jgi:hypothetical protein
VPRDALIIRAEGLYIVRINGQQRAELDRDKSGA